MYISAGHIDITPEQELPLFGFASRKANATGVNDRLEANLIALKDDKKLVLMYSIDTLFVPIQIEDELLKHFAERYGLTRADVWLMASHTHFAPSIDDDKPALGVCDKAYYQFVLDKLIELTQTVLDSEFVKTSIKYGRSSSVLNVNRRKKLLRPGGTFGLKMKTLIYPDHDGDKDSDIHFIRFDDEAGKTIASFWNYACHPVGFVNRTEVSADYIGGVRDALRKQNNEHTVVFSIGFAGDLKPDVTPVTNTRWLDRLGYLFQLRPKYTRFPNINSYKNWVELLIAEVNNADNNASSTSAVAINTTSTSIPLKDVISTNDKELHFKKMSIADDIHFVGVSAEVLVGHKKIVSNAIQQQTINIGCLAGTDIYLPTDKNIREGGYEVEIFKDMFNVEGEFKKGIDDIVYKAIQSL